MLTLRTFRSWMSPPMTIVLWSFATIMRLRAALRGRGAELRIAVDDLLGLHLDQEPDVPALVDLRLDLEPELHGLALDGRVEGGQPPTPSVEPSAARVPVVPPEGVPEPRRREARLERHVLADGDLGLLVVRGEDVRRREDVHVRARLERLHEDAERREVDAEEASTLPDGGR